MGKGDKKTKKGKIWMASFGVSRSRKAIKAKLKRISLGEPKSKKADLEATPVVAKKKVKRVTKKKVAEVSAKTDAS